MAAPPEDSKLRAQKRFFLFYQELLVEAGGPQSAWARATAAGVAAPAAAASRSGGSDIDMAALAAEALKLAGTDMAPEPKYFSCQPPKERTEALVAIDAVVATEAEKGKAEPERGRKLYSDFFLLCMALKKRKGSTATDEDANFDAELVDRFFEHLPDEALDESLEALGTLLDSLLEQGVDDQLATSPAKLRAVLLMLVHPCLQDPGDESKVVLQKLMGLVHDLRNNDEAKQVLIRWYAAMPLNVLERHVVQVQQFVTLSLLDGQSNLGIWGSDSVTRTLMLTRLAQEGNLARHIRNALRLLEIYWCANECRRARFADWRTRRKAMHLRDQGQLLDGEEWQHLSPSQFHNDAINQCEGLLRYDLREVNPQQQRGTKFPKLDEARRMDFGIIEFPFVLTAVSKVRMLNIQSMLMQRSEVMSRVHNLLFANPFLVLKVRRSAVIEDALQQLAVYRSIDFKKPLKVIFDGEEAVDEGGVQKEFFQLLIEEMYNEDFGMFERVEESRNFWFNKNSFETNLQFELFGIILGLAIYNQVILDIKFPMAVYKKLMGDASDVLGLSDLLDFEPTIAKSLIQILEHQPEPGRSLEDDFGPLRFVVEYERFGERIDAELIDGGRDMPVTVENREDYVQRYCDWIFNTSVQGQYDSFRKGFDQCIGDTLFRQLFRHDELELVICGSMELDFHALEKAAQYQDGFTAQSEAVLWFWEVVHSLNIEEKKSFLQFCTGCDRAPVGGLGRLQFIISRAGPDSEMLPWVHTCFNHLLLPAYSSKEKLETRLRTAIQHSTGFGLM